MDEVQKGKSKGGQIMELKSKISQFLEKQKELPPTRDEELKVVLDAKDDKRKVFREHDDENQQQGVPGSQKTTQNQQSSVQQPPQNPMRAVPKVKSKVQQQQLHSKETDHKEAKQSDLKQVRNVRDNIAKETGPKDVRVANDTANHVRNVRNNMAKETDPNMEVSAKQSEVKQVKKETVRHYKPKVFFVDKCERNSKLTPGVKTRVKLTHVESPSRFFIRTIESDEFVTKAMPRIIKTTKEFQLDKWPPQSNFMFAYYCPDEQMMERAKVMAVEVNRSIIVNLIDVGRQLRLTKSSLTKMFRVNKPLLELPPLACPATLVHKDIETLAAQHLQNEFNQMGGDLCSAVTQFQTDPYVVKLELDGVPIVNHLSRKRNQTTISKVQLETPIGKVNEKLETTISKVSEKLESTSSKVNEKLDMKKKDDENELELDQNGYFKVQKVTDIKSTGEFKIKTAQNKSMVASLHNFTCTENHVDEVTQLFKTLVTTDDYLLGKLKRNSGKERSALIVELKDTEGNNVGQLLSERLKSEKLDLDSKDRVFLPIQTYEKPPVNKQEENLEKPKVLTMQKNEESSKNGPECEEANLKNMKLLQDQNGCFKVDVTNVVSPALFTIKLANGKTLPAALYNIVPKEVEYSNDTIDSFTVLVGADVPVKKKDFVLVAKLRRKAPICLIDLWDTEGNNVSELLVQMGLVEKVKCFYHKLPVLTVQTCATDNVVLEFHNLTENANELMVKRTKRLEALEKEMGEMLQYLNEADKQLEKDLLVLLRFKNKYYRARVMELHDSSSTVDFYCLDVATDLTLCRTQLNDGLWYDKEDMNLKFSVLQFPPELLAHEVSTLKIQLSGISPDLKVDEGLLIDPALAFFQTHNKFKVKSVDSKGHVTLRSKENFNLNEDYFHKVIQDQEVTGFVAAKKATLNDLFKAKLFPPGHSFCGLVISYDKDMFWVLLDIDTEDYFDMQKSLKVEKSQNFRPQLDDLCRLVLGNECYRVLVTQVSSEATQCLMLDVGDVHVVRHVDKEKDYFLPDIEDEHNLSKKPPFVYPCVLQQKYRDITEPFFDTCRNEESLRATVECHEFLPNGMIVNVTLTS